MPRAARSGLGQLPSERGGGGGVEAISKPQLPAQTHRIPGAAGKHIGGQKEERPFSQVLKEYHAEM